VGRLRLATFLSKVKMRRRSLLFVAPLVPPALLLFSVVGHWGRTADVRVTMADVTSGPIVRRFISNGTFVLARIVDTGTQMSGTIRQDPAAFDTEVAKAAAGVMQSQADVARLTTAAKDARTKLTRAEARSLRTPWFQRPISRQRSSPHGRPNRIEGAGSRTAVAARHAAPGAVNRDRSVPRSMASS
jgi:hypothetical protein